MNKEIERKYLIDRLKLPRLDDGLKIKQGYIPTANKSTVRIRHTGQLSYITIKSPTIGITRSEFEYIIPDSDAYKMLQFFCPPPHIEKTRYKIKYSNHIWEIDYFHGLNDGLVIAEVELQHEPEMGTSKNINGMGVWGKGT